MNYSRHYVQFEDLVFDEIGMVSEDATTVRYKSFSEPYTFRHGSYSPQKTPHKLLQAGSVSMTITLKMKKLPCDMRPFYPRFAKAELSKSIGRLWAVQNNELLWAWAEPSTYRESVENYTNTLDIDLNFDLPEGVWHKADKLKTFLIPYDPCMFMDCYEFKEVDPCYQMTNKKDCCDCSSEEIVEYCDCCGDRTVSSCEHVDEDSALCYTKDLSGFFSCDPVGYKIVVDCEAAERFFGGADSKFDKGQKFCDLCGHLIAGKIYSNTDLPTGNIKLTIRGKLHNPYIEINGNANIIEGDYDGILEIHPDGTVYAYDESCGPCEPLPVSSWIVPPGMKYGWEIQQGYNKLIFDPGACCGAVCIYVEADEITV